MTRVIPGQVFDKFRKYEGSTNTVFHPGGHLPSIFVGLNETPKPKPIFSRP